MITYKSPTMMEYEVGTSTEIILFNILERLINEKVEKIIVISMYDVFHIIYQHITSLIPEERVNIILKNTLLVSVNPISEIILKPRVISFLSPEALSKRITAEIIRHVGKEKRAITLLVGSEIYALKEGLQQFISFYQFMVSSSFLHKNLSSLILIDFKTLSENLLEILRLYSANVVRFAVENNVSFKDIKRYLLIFKSMFLEYELKKWYYEIKNDKLEFFTE